MEDIHKYFITTIAPNGFSIDKNGKHKLMLSVCLDIDIDNLAENQMEIDDDLQFNNKHRLYFERFMNFYTSFENLHKNFTFENLQIYKNAVLCTASQKNGYCPSFEIKEKELKRIKDLLWEKIFFYTSDNPLLSKNKSQVGTLSTIARNIAFPKPLSMSSKLSYLNKSDFDESMASFFSATSKTSKMNRFSAQKKDDFFHSQLHKLLGDKSSFYSGAELIKENKLAASRDEILDVLKFRKINIASYLASNVEPEEFISTFNIINKNVVLKRLMGFIIDVEIEVEASEVDIKIKAEIGKNFCNLESSIVKIQSEEKFAYLLRSSNAYFKNTILDGSSGDIELLAFDKVGQEHKLISQEEKKKRNEDVSISEKADSFTRGIILYHKQLGELVQSIKYDRSDTLVINESRVLEEDYFVHGQRVAVLNTKDQVLRSITNRSVKILDNENKIEILKCPTSEGTIHFDAVIHKTNEVGGTEYYTPDVMFEWNGQQLTLKSAFSSSKKVSALDRALDNQNNPGSDGVEMSQIKCEPHIFVDSFPFKKIDYGDKKNIKPDLSLLYGLPKIENGNNVPRLMFGNEYRFIVYHEYKNGWGLPLNTDKSNPNQLSVADLGKDLMTDPIKFNPLENKKPVLLYHTKKIQDEDFNINVDADSKIEHTAIPLSERESLEHLIVRSENSDDSDELIAERHILPERISMEHAFWYGLLFEKMSIQETLKWKKKYNCQYHSEDEYDTYINEKDKNGESKQNRCTEGCAKYCGGTQMETFYSNSHIYPNFLTDPTVLGFSIQLFWDKACKNQPVLINNNPVIKTLSFGGTAGISPKSCFLQARGAKEETYVEGHDWLKKIQVYLKKGMHVYAQLVNDLIEDKQGNADNALAWYHDKKQLFSSHQPSKDDDLNKLIRNPPKIITLTHAVREPLLVPEIHSLCSSPIDHRQIEHIHEWLKEKRYQSYKIEKNIIARRINQNNRQAPSINSSYAVLELTSHFERLDATDKIHFLDEVIPTGSLELWMRKEEYVDDPDHIVLDPKALGYKKEYNHQPNLPVLSFKDKAPYENKFSLEYKIKFTNEILAQLKDLRNVNDIDGISDVFRSLISKLNLEYDLKTTKFEEREYYLKNISKFKGYFTNEEFVDDNTSKAIDKLEDYALPKTEDIMRNLGEDSDLCFKVMVLNNRQPEKPEVAFAVTTIQETRSYPESKKTISIQRGNIVTIYLKRGRLSSGRDERVGVIVDADGLYSKLFKDGDLISKAGRDIISDRYSNRSQYLQYGDIVIPQVNDYEADFDNELGIYHFLPQFDVQKQLWKFEVELDIKTKDGKQLHNPFVNFTIVHFQPFSLNYNDKIADSSLLELRNDCRISDIENSTWCYLLPERKLSVYFDTPNFLFNNFGDVDLTASYDYESLHHFNYEEDKWKVRTNFILTVQGTHDGIIWNSIKSWLDKDNPDIDKKEGQFHHPLLSENIILNEENIVRMKLKFTKWADFNDTANSQQYSKFRVRFIEVEWFLNESWQQVIEKNDSLLVIDLVDKEDLRIRFVELIY